MLSALAQAALESDLAGKVQARWPPTPRTAWRPPWRGWGGRLWPATREFSRSAADAEKHSPELTEIAQLVGGFSKFAARGAARRESDQ
jgi:hypothetical protein